MTSERRASFLELIADNVKALRDALVARASAQTGLTRRTSPRNVQYVVELRTMLVLVLPLPLLRDILPQREWTTDDLFDKFVGD